MALSYEQILERSPKSTDAGDKLAALEFVSLLTQVLTGQGTEQLSNAQKNYLYKMRVKWQQRGEGRDLRWNSMGTKPGRAKKVSATVRGYRNEEETDPLLASLLRKYGTPRVEEA